MKDEELLEAFEQVERFIDYRYRKSHGNLFLILGIYFFIAIIFSGYGHEISEAINISPALLGISMFMLFIFLYLLFVGRGFHVAYKTGLDKLEKEKKASFKKKERISYLSLFLILFFIFVFMGYTSSHIPFCVVWCIGVGIANIAIFVSNKKIYGKKHYHEELLWAGLVLLVSAPIVFLVPSNFSILFTAFLFLGIYSGIVFHIYSDAERILRESLTGGLGKLLSSESKLSSPVRLGIMILLRTKSKMVFSEIQKTLRLTPGNLDSHLRHLEKSGYVHIKKGLSLKGPRTIVEITPEGEENLKRYVSKLKLALSYKEK